MRLSIWRAFHVGPKLNLQKITPCRRVMWKDYEVTCISARSWFPSITTWYIRYLAREWVWAVYGYWILYAVMLYAYRSNTVQEILYAPNSEAYYLYLFCFQNTCYRISFPWHLITGDKGSFCSTWTFWCFAVFNTYVSWVLYIILNM